MTKIAGSGSISQRHGSPFPDPDPYQNVTDPQHWFQQSLGPKKTRSFWLFAKAVKKYYIKGARQCGLISCEGELEGVESAGSSDEAEDEEVRCSKLMLYCITFKKIAISIVEMGNTEHRN
jgi:hypothetical protein